MYNEFIIQKQEWVDEKSIAFEEDLASCAQDVATLIARAPSTNPGRIANALAQLDIKHLEKFLSTIRKVCVW